jgi:hypothetical protein
MPAAVVMATVADPSDSRMSAAIDQPSTSGGTGNPAATLATAPPTPLAFSTPPKPPPAPMISRMPASGARQSSLNFSTSARV